MLMRGCGALPLFARLSPAEPDRIFDGHSGFSEDAGVCIEAHDRAALVYRCSKRSAISA